MKFVDRKPQQQTLSIRISESLREFLERSKKVIATGRDGVVSTSDVAKILLESAKDDGLDYRLEVAELGQKPTEAMVGIRKKWELGQPRSRAEWIFMSQYIQTACEELTGDPLAPGAESYAVLLESLLAVRGLRADRGSGLDKYYLGNLVDGAVWNDRKLDSETLPKAISKLIEDVRSSGSGKQAAGVGRCLYVAIRDEEFDEIATLNSVLAPHMNTLFRMAARGFLIKEHSPVRLLRDGSLLLDSIPRIEQGNLSLSVQPGSTDIHFAVGIDTEFMHVIYTLSGYAQIREFAAMLRTLSPDAIWTGVNFHASASADAGCGSMYYQLRRNQDGVMLSFGEENWNLLKELIARGMAEPRLKAIFSELSLIYGEL
jgi:hypothetical protein